MTTVSHAYAKAIFDLLPGTTRRDKSQALASLIDLLRAERDTFPRANRSGRTLLDIRDQLVGKNLGAVQCRTVDVDGVTITVPAIAGAYLMPGHILHDRAKAMFEAAGLTVEVIPTSRRPGRRIVEAPKPGEAIVELRRQLHDRYEGGAA
jgi:hypothetical protein